MKKINFIIPTLSSGGAERVVSNLSLLLNDDFHCNIILLNYDTEIMYPYKGTIEYLDKENHRGNFFLKIKTIIMKIYRLKKSKQKDTSAVTISFLEYPNLINILSHGKEPMILSVRNHMSTKHGKNLKGIIWNYSIKHLYPKANKIVAVSKEIKKDLINNYQLDESKIKVIYNSYPIEKIQELSIVDVDSEYVDIFNHPVVITVGRLNAQKGHWHLIRSFSRVKKNIPDAKLVILGEGNMENYLKNLAIELNLKKDIHFLGFQKNPFKFISKSKIFVLSSFHEGFPNALAEAMACGIPVLSTDCLSGPREILAPDEFHKQEIVYGLNKDRYGVLLPVCDGKRYSSDYPLSKEELTMAESIITVLNDEEMRKYFSKQSLSRIKDFEIKNLISEWENILGEKF
ncbi:MAG: glycosyltransferase [Clostridiales bacterium]|nr:glycosyltransferase [Clostridiales bacterium]